MEDIEWNVFHDCVLIYESKVSRLYRARKGGRYFILKTLNWKNGTPADEELYLLKREFLLSQGIVHPNIADVYLYEGDSPVGPCIVMEYVDGCNLNEFLGTNPDIRTKKKIFGQILDAVELIHSHGVTHNDIKPENILVTTKGSNVRLIDFGFSSNEAQYLAKHIGFTAKYAAPEAVRAEGAVDERSDIFSIGLLMNDIFGRRYSWIVRKCTREDKERRYGNIAALRRAWHRARYLKLYLVAIAAVGIAAAAITDLAVSNRQMSRQLEEITAHENAMDSLLSVAYAHIDEEFERTAQKIRQAKCRELAFQAKCRFTIDICKYKKEYCDNNFTTAEDRVAASGLIDNYETELSDKLLKLFDNYPTLEELKKTLPEDDYRQLSEAVTSGFLQAGSTSFKDIRFL